MATINPPTTSEDERDTIEAVTSEIRVGTYRITRQNEAHWIVRRVDEDGSQIGDSCWSETQAGAHIILHAMKATDAVFGQGPPAPYGIPDAERLEIMERNSRRSSFFHSLIRLATPEGA